jgi:hypothetical protein
LSRLSTLGVVKVLRYLGLADLAAGLGLILAGLLVTGGIRTPLLAIGGFLILFGSMVLLIGRRIGPVLSLTPLWLAGGTPAEAAVTVSEATGITINGRAVARLDLEVTPRNEHPYSVRIRQQVPEGFGKAVEAGSRVPVRIHPGDRRQVAVEWAQVGRPADPGDGAQIVPPVPHGRRRSTADLLATGRRGSGGIKAMTRIGELVDLGLADPGDAGWEDDLFRITLEVKLPGFDPYEVTVAHRVPDRLVGRVGPGLRVPVAADRDDHERNVAIDWDAVDGG